MRSTPNAAIQFQCCIDLLRPCRRLSYNMSTAAGFSDSLFRRSSRPEPSPLVPLSGIFMIGLRQPKVDWKYDVVIALTVIVVDVIFVCVWASLPDLNNDNNIIETDQDAQLHKPIFLDNFTNRIRKKWYLRGRGYGRNFSRKCQKAQCRLRS